MKYIKMYEDVIQDFINLKDNYKSEKQRILSLINYFCKEIIDIEVEYGVDFFRAIDFKLNINGIKIIFFEDDFFTRKDSVFLSPDDFEKFKNFINDPEVYKDANKYNL